MKRVVITGRGAITPLGNTVDSMMDGLAQGRSAVERHSLVGAPAVLENEKSTMGSAASITETFELILPERDIAQLPSTKFFQCVSHTATMNISQYLGITGTVLAPAAACASGLQALGVGYDLIRMGRQDRVLCGGAEELHPTVTGFAAATDWSAGKGRASSFWRSWSRR